MAVAGLVGFSSLIELAAETSIAVLCYRHCRHSMNQAYQTSQSDGMQSPRILSSLRVQSHSRLVCYRDLTSVV